MSKKLVVFDLDGTLVDSAQVVAAIINQLRREIGKDVKEVEFFIPWLSLGGEELIANGLGIKANQVTPYLHQFRLRYAESPTPVDSLYDGVTDLLDHLIERGIRVSVCTNKPRNLAEKVLIDTGLDRYFKQMCAGGDLKTKKPSPENLDVCIKYFGEKYEDTLLIGDSTVDQKVSKSLGVDFALFRGGYNDGVDENKIVFAFEHHSEVKQHFN